jgi:hypothetical protein
MSNDTLQIQQMKAVNAYWYAIRFTGPEQTFKSLTGLLGRERYWSYWIPSEFDGLGGWHVEKGMLQRCASYFSNLEQKLNSLTEAVVGKES